MSAQALKSLWERTVIKPRSSNTEPNDWHNEMQTLYKMGIGMEETLRFLYATKPDFDQFVHWLNHQTTLADENDTKNQPDTLSADDLRFWKQNGYVVIKNAISKNDCENTRHAIWEFLGMNPENSDTWYKPHQELRGLMLTFTNHPQLHKNRQSLKIKKAYEQIYQSNRIYKTIDKVSFNPPQNVKFSFAGDGLHWDVSLKQPIPFCLQGLLYLTDCSETDGAFHCVPGFHNQIESWIYGLPAGANPRGLAPVTLKPVAVPGKAGDFIIWHQALPHCATPNLGSHPRMVQYLTYKPFDYTEQNEWI